MSSALATDGSDNAPIGDAGRALRLSRGGQDWTPKGQSPQRLALRPSVLQTFKILFSWKEILDHRWTPMDPARATTCSPVIVQGKEHLAPRRRVRQGAPAARGRGNL